MHTKVDLINLSPLAPLDSNIPERVWTGKDVSYKHLRVFGYRAYVHIPKDKRSKLDDKAKECIFLGYGHEEFGYILWDLVARKLIRSRDVIFLEDHIFGNAEKSNEPQSSPKIPIIPTSVSPTVVHNDHGGAGETNTDSPIELVDQRPPESPAPPIEPELRRSTRERRSSTRYPPHKYMMLIDEGEPEHFEEAISHQHKSEWVKVMQEEMRGLNENHTYGLVKLPKGKRALKNKWFNRLKNENNSQ